MSRNLVFILSIFLLLGVAISCQKPTEVTTEDLLIGKWVGVASVPTKVKGELVYYHHKLEWIFRENGKYQYIRTLVERSEVVWWEKGRWKVKGSKIFFCIEECMERGWKDYSFALEFELGDGFLILGNRVYSRR